MTEAELLARAGELPGARDVAGARFTALLASPLLIPHVRSAGGRGGRRVTAGMVVADQAAFAVLVEDSDHQPSLSITGNATACAHAFAEQLRRAGRAGLSAEPPAVAPDGAALVAAGAALLA